MLRSGAFKMFPVSPDLLREAIKMYRIGTADIGFLDIGCQDIGFRILDSGYWILDIGSCLSDIISESVYLEYIRVPKPSWS